MENQSDFSGTKKAVKLKHKDSRLMHPVYQIQGQGPIALRITSLDRLYNLPFTKHFRHTFL